MTSKFASGRNAIGICDICGFRFKLRELREVIVKARRTNILACNECKDEDHPQLRLGEFPINDPQALRNPRPDPALAASREIPDNGQSIEDLYTP